jgi:hypothetical protein
MWESIVTTRGRDSERKFDDDCDRIGKEEAGEGSKTELLTKSEML